jgi:hypothetical protein
MALNLGFHKEDGVGKSYHTDAPNASFLFLLDLVEKHAHCKCITNAITKKFTHVVKELEMRKMEMAKYIRCQMIWNEEK